jgi:hypothetical protein
LKDYDVSIPISDTKKKLEESNNKLKAIQQKKKRISQVYESSNTMDYTDFQKKIDECKREEEKIKNEILLLGQKVLRKNEVKASVEHFENLFEELKSKVMSATYEEKSEVIHLLVEKIHIYKQKELAEVKLNIPIFEPTTIQNGQFNRGLEYKLRTYRFNRIPNWQTNTHRWGRGQTGFARTWPEHFFL